MNRSRRNVAWSVLAWAAVVAQAAPQALCRDCERPCCAAHEVLVSADHTATAAAATCPACAAAEATACAAADASAQAVSGGRPAGEPCHCQLDARPGQPLAVARGHSSRDIGGDPAILPPAPAPAAPASLVATREYLAASLAIPIRPPRILHGVWRN